MGRQIRFLQSEEDIKVFFEILHDFNVKTIIKILEWKHMDLNMAVQSAINSMQGSGCQYAIIPPQVVVEDLEQMQSQFLHRMHLTDNGTAVEYWGCKKWELEPNSYMMGRLYVSTYYEGEEQEIAQKFFEKLKRVIKKDIFIIRATMYM